MLIFYKGNLCNIILQVLTIINLNIRIVKHESYKFFVLLITLTNITLLIVKLHFDD